jgi:hypothetical protein
MAVGYSQYNIYHFRSLLTSFLAKSYLLRQTGSMWESALDWNQRVMVVFCWV